MLIGNAALFFIALMIVSHKFSSLLVPSLIYWGITISVIVARYIDIRHMNGETAEGKPATIENWKRHALLMGLVASAIWIGAIGIAMFSTK